MIVHDLGLQRFLPAEQLEVWAIPKVIMQNYKLRPRVHTGLVPQRHDRIPECETNPRSRRAGGYHSLRNTIKRLGSLTALPPNLQVRFPRSMVNCSNMQSSDAAITMQTLTL